MAAISKQMSTTIALDTVKAQESIRGLTQAVSTMTSAWRAQEAQLRASGDYLQASEAKFEGLGRAVEAQRAKLEALKREQEELGKGTNANSEQYLKYENQINQATAKLASLEAQQQKAKQAMDYQKSGLADLQSEYRKSSEVSESLVRRLEAEGNHYESLKAKRAGALESVKNLTQQYEKQKAELDKLDRTDGGFAQQQVRVNRTAEALAKARNSVSSLDREMKSLNPSIFSRMSEGLAQARAQSKGLGGSLQRVKEFMTGQVLGQGLVTLAGKLKEGAIEGFQLAKAGQETAERLKALGYSTPEITKMTNAMGELKKGTALTGATAKQLVERFSSMTGSVDTGTKLAKGFGVLTNQFKLTDDQAKALSGSFSRIYSSGKLTSGVLARMEKSTPGVTKAFANMAGTTVDNFKKMVDNGEISSDKFNQMMAGQAKNFDKSAKDYQGSMRGMGDYLHKTWQGLESAFAKPIMTEATKQVKSFRSQFDDKAIEKFGKTLGDVASGGLKTLAGALSTVAKHKDLFKNLALTVGTFMVSFKAVSYINSAVGAVKSFASGVSSLGGVIAANPIGAIAVGITAAVMAFKFGYDHSKKFRKAVNSLGEKLKGVGQSVLPIAKTAFKTFGNVIKALAPAFKPVASAAMELGKAVGQYLVTAFKALSPVAKVVGTVLGTVAKGIAGVLNWAAKHGVITALVKVAFTPLVVVLKAASAAFKLVTGAIKVVMQLFSGNFKGALGTVTKGFKSVGSAVGKFAGKLTGKLASGVAKGAKSLGNLASKGIKSMSKLASGAGKHIKSFASGIGSKIAGGTGKAQKTFSKFTGAISKGASKLSKSSNKIFASMGKKVEGIFSKMSKSAKKSHDKMGKDSSKGMKKTSKETIKQAQKMAKDVQKQFEKLKKTSKKLFKDLPKEAKKVFKDVSKQVNTGQKNINKKLKALEKTIKSFDKNYDKTFNNLSKKTNKFTSKTKKDLKSIDKLVKDGTRWQKQLEKNTQGLNKTIHKVMAAIQKEWDKAWDRIAESSVTAFNKVLNTERKVFEGQIYPSVIKTNDSIAKNFKSNFDKTTSNYNNFWSQMKKATGNGMNAIIDTINQGVSGINSLVGSFGGNKNAIGKISPVKFASGTGVFSNDRRPITNPTLAMLNDGSDSPETNNQETVILPDGSLMIPKGNNVTTLLPAGSEVLNATETKMLGLHRFASGTGLLSAIFNQAQKMSVPGFNSQTDDGKQKMVDYIGDAVDKTKEKFGALFNPLVDRFGGFFKEFQHAIDKPVDSEGQSWYSALFKMAQEKLGAINATAGMIGDDYPANLKAGAVGASSDPWGYFVKECVSFVAARLNNLGVNPALFSHLGNGNEWINARVPHVAAKPGTVAVYSHGGQNHVSYVTAVHDGMFDGEEYNWMNAHSYHQYTNRPLSMATTFLDFGVKVKSKEEESAEVDKNLDARQKLAKQQTDPMMKWIEDNLAEFAGGGADNLGGTGVERWRPYVIRALKANGLDPTEHRVSSMLRLIQRESNGDPNVANGWDSNAAAGNPSIGLTQTTISTFNSNKHKGHDNIRNGYDNLLASIRYIIGRYGTSDAVFTRVADYAYANGGRVGRHGVYELAENNMPEYIIPTDKAKRSRSWKLVKDLVSEFVEDEPDELRRKKRERGEEGNDKFDKLMDKVDTMVSLLASLVSGQDRPINANVRLDAKSFAEELAPYATKANKTFTKRDNLLRGLT